MDINFDDIKKRFGKKAKEYSGDKVKTKSLLDDAIKKAKKKGPFEEMWESLQLLFGIVKSWIDGSYTEIPTGSLI
jgi:hypothetical protein